MSLAGLVNAAMLLVAAALFHGSGAAPATDTLERAHAGLATALDGSARPGLRAGPARLGLRLGERGHVRRPGDHAGLPARRIPLFARRALTLLPALASSRSASSPPGRWWSRQVVLSFGIPFALVPLLLLTRRRDVMGELVNAPRTTAVAALVAVVIIGLNAMLLVLLL